MIAPARTAALRILSAVSAGRADLPAALASSRAGLSDERDRALAAEISTGVLRWRAALDHLIVHFAKRPIERLDPEILEILRLSAYQLIHLTRVPAPAIVSDAVNLTHKAAKTSASGFVNAVLRAMTRQRRNLPLPARPDDPNDDEAALAYLSTTLSHPRWLASRWYARYGFEAAEQWMRFNNRPASLTLRTNTLQTTAVDLAARLVHEGVRIEPGHYAPDALIVQEGHPLQGEGLAQGWFVVQDEASQLVALLAGRTPGTRVLDACASPGGKSVAIAGAMKGRGLLVACDIRARRMNLLKRTIAASRAPNIRLVQADVSTPLPFSQPFDCVLVDAPCSGLGTLRRDPDIKWRRQESDLTTLAGRQLDLLRQAAASVRPGGRLVYATCSSEPEENEGVARAFLLTAHDFMKVDLSADDNTDLPAAVVDNSGHLRTYPHVHNLEAFYGAVFVRR